MPTRRGRSRVFFRWKSIESDDNAESHAKYSPATSSLHTHTRTKTQHICRLALESINTQYEQRSSVRVPEHQEDRLVRAMSYQIMDKFCTSNIRT